MLSSVDAARAVDAVVDGARARDLEGQHLEFKVDIGRSADDTLRMLAETAACLANGQGGVVVVGVDDRLKGPGAVIGTQLDIDVTRHRLFELTLPGLVVGVEQMTRERRNLLILTVPVSPTLHSVGGRCTERMGASCQPMTPDRIASVITDRRAEDWSAQDSGLGVEAVDPIALVMARAMLQRVDDPARRAFAGKTDPDLLRSLGVVTERSTLTNAGALLLTVGLPMGELLAYVYRRSPSGALMVNEHLHAPLLSALQRVFDLVDVRVDTTSVNIGRGQQLQVADLPETAVREALVNAVMHRDYRRPGEIVAEHAPTRFAVTSPGPFLTGITPQNVLTTASRTRNHNLATAIRTLGLAETAGTGVDRMFAAMARVGHQPPVYTAGTDHVQVVMTGGAPNAHMARYTASLPPEEAAEADTMLVLLALLARRTIGADAAAPVLQRNVAETQGVLARLATPPIEMLEPTRQTAHRSLPSYRLRSHVLAALGPAVTYNRRTTDDDDRKVMTMVRETGQVNARMIRVLLDVDGPTASRILGDLVSHGVLTKTSSAQRGRSVTYGPGPAFPSATRGRRATATPRGRRGSKTGEGSE